MDSLAMIQCIRTYIIESVDSNSSDEPDSP